MMGALMAAWIVACGQAVTALPLGPLLPLLVDVRTQAEWDAGHIRCAHLLPVQDDPLLISTVRQLVGGDLTAPIITYCHSGVRAGRAETALKAAGFLYVRNGGGYAIPPSNTAALERLCSPVLVPTVTIAPGVLRSAAQR